MSSTDAASVQKAERPCGIEDGISWRCRDVVAQAPGHLALLCARARTLASVCLTPANGFPGQTASGSAGVAGVAGPTLEDHKPREGGLFTSTGPTNLTALLRARPGAEGEGGMQLAAEASRLAGSHKSSASMG